MKIAYSNLACPEWSFQEVIGKAVEYGYDGVEIRLLDGEVIAPDLDRHKRHEMVQLARDSGVGLIGIGASTRFAMANVEEQRQNERNLISYLELSADMEIPMVRTFGGPSGIKHLGLQQLKDCVNRVAESLNRVAPRAEELGVDVLLETHDEFSSSYMVRDTLDLVQSPRIGALWDIHHPYRMDEAVNETYENLKGRLRHVHLKDASRNGEGWDLVLFGRGEVPVQSIVSMLKQDGYDDYLTIEWEKKWHPEIEAADVALPQHISILKNYLGNTANVES